MEGTLFLILVQDLQLVFASLGTGPARGGLSKFLPFMNSVHMSLVVSLAFIPKVCTAVVSISI